MSTDWKFTNCKQKPLILFSSLDWGLGHTTRSVPLIKELLSLGCNLIVACNSIQKALLQPEFPGLKYVVLGGYDITYGTGKWTTSLKIGLQLSKILTRIKHENSWLKSFIKENPLDGLISDNRYGLYHPNIHSVIISHQLHIYSGYGSVADKISQKIIYHYINRFSTCWIPDFSKKNSLAGILSHPVTLPNVPVSYLGALSRFETCLPGIEKKYDLLIIISGPEPQRTIFEKIMVEQSALLNKKIAIVRGLPGDREKMDHPTIKIFNHLDSHQLNRLICESELIICRSGYTTVMDIVKLKKNMIVIPTPGQPEQKYLAGYLSQNHYALSFPQKSFSLQRALDAASAFTFIHVDSNMDEYKIVLKEFVEKISSLSPSLKR